MSANKIASTNIASVITTLCLSLFGGGPAWAASPNLWWDHSGPLDMNQSECVAKAKKLLSDNDAGTIQASQDSLHAKNDSSISVIECLSFGEGMTVMVVVSSNNLAHGDKLFNSLKNGMAK